MKESRLMRDKKERNLQKLTDRYYGKKDLLEEWEMYPLIDPGYLNDLRRRVRGHHNDLAYRGADEFVETLP